MAQWKLLLGWVPQDFGHGKSRAWTDGAKADGQSSHRQPLPGHVWSPLCRGHFRFVASICPGTSGSNLGLLPPRTHTLPFSGSEPTIPGSGPQR